MRKLIWSFAVAGILLSVQANAMAWNHTGHRVVALVAYKTLDATTKAKIFDSTLSA